MGGHIKTVKSQIREFENAAVETVIKEADVILCTLAGAARYEIKEMKFDCCVIDEAAQALEVACWIPILKSERVVLAGDHQQLGPTIKHSEAKDLETTLFQRVEKLYGDQCLRMLKIQYRMHEVIAQYFSDALYHGKLEAHESVASHL